MGISTSALLGVILKLSTAVAARGSFWQHRKDSLISQNALYGRVILREELPALRQLVQASWALPHSKRASFAYLIQGEEDVSLAENTIWSSGSEAFVLTFRVQRSDALFFPNSLLAEGRNVLLAAAALEEFRRGYRYTYYMLLDGDVQFQPPWPIAQAKFLSFLSEWAPAVGLPAYIDGPATGDGADEPRAVCYFDHIFLAVHADAIPNLLPYDVTFDRPCAWVSQWTFTLLASALFKDHVLMLPSVRVVNTRHGSYRKEQCFDEMVKASERLRAAAPPAAQNCFPDPLHSGLVLPEVPELDRQVQAHNYVPWGSPRRHAEDADYANRTLESLSGCDDEVLVSALKEPSPASWCRGCDMAESMLLLQSMTAANPYWVSNWNSMGCWLSIGSPGYKATIVASVCFVIAMRLQRLKGKKPDMIVVHNLMRARDALLAENIRMNESSLWEDDGARVREMILAALHVQGAPNTRRLHMLSGRSLTNFVSYLVTGVLAK
eukprot:gnl/TRDRNA2_/TRDRNA2_159899_c0_seq1.p1 gnl/TRDRNA2_/TRDRNA2_159899_c0~~gnl/TRDRNA2_/TRDRNA2_159899_c0_seq1.p1  ORF type:complete len:494 (+),score=71.67 gnl/TRDRNA2_/TRDRNA2_159899_c0_seq1:174-1655(+)